MKIKKKLTDDYRRRRILELSVSELNIARRMQVAPTAESEERGMCQVSFSDVHITAPGCDSLAQSYRKGDLITGSCSMKLAGDEAFLIPFEQSQKKAH